MWNYHIPIGGCKRNCPGRCNVISRILKQPRNFCALGSQHTISAIQGALPIVHSGSACCLRLYRGMSFCNGCQGMGYGGGNGTPNDNIHRPDFIYGGEKRIKDLIEGTLQIMKADLYVVLTGCNVELAGDNISAVVREFRKKGVPIVFAETAGFKGSAYLGHEWVVKAIIEQFVTEEAAEETTVEEKMVNLWMSVPYMDPFWRGDMEVLKEMLEKIGLKVNLLFGSGSDTRNWKRIPSAQFNLLLSPWVGLETMELLKQRFGTPYLHYPVLPIGAYECRRFLQQVSEFAGLDMAVVTRCIQQEENGFYYHLERASELLTYYNNSFPERFFIIADSMYTLGIARFLFHDLGLVLGSQYITDNPPKKYRKYIEGQFSSLAQDNPAQVVFIEDPADIRESIEKQIGEMAMTPFILGSSWDLEIVSRIGGYFLEISAPVSGRLVMDRSYAGYRGGLRLAEDIFSTILSN